MKLTNIVKRILSEANLVGYSRSGGKPSWDHYIATNFDSSKVHVADADGIIYDQNKKEIGSIKKGDTLNILSPELKLWGQSKFANIKKISDGVTGFLSIASIQKPSGKNYVGKIGGIASKEFLPTKLGLVNDEYTDKNKLIADTIDALEKNYGDEKYSEIREYLTECMYLLSGDIQQINESSDVRKSYKLSKKYDISNQDINILSKNFGEVLACIYVISTNDVTEKVFFPEKANSPLYDFVAVKKTGMNEYYSVKSHGGSSTSVENINFLLKNFSEDNELFDKYSDEIETIKSIINDKTAGKTTLTNIENFFSKKFPDKVTQIINKLNKISKYKVSSISQDDLTNWFNDVVNNSDENSFINTINDIYSSVLSDIGSSPKTSQTVLKKFFTDKFSKGNGYLYYPMGAYIKDYLNDKKNSYLKVLNILLNYGSYIHQFDVNLSSDSFDIKIGSFSQKKFKFSYNAMSNSPANRPLGFKEAGSRGVADVD